MKRKSKVRFENDLNGRFVSALRRRCAETAVGSSSARRMIRRGRYDHARRFLKEKVKLQRLSKLTDKKFLAELDRLTRQFQKHMRWGDKKWGAARKFLNIFLRDCAYAWCTRESYELARLEPILEIPVDSYVAKRLKREREGAELPRWKGVIHLDQKGNIAYQKVASRVAKRRKLHRVHLDVLYWRGDKNKGSRNRS